MASMTRFRMFQLLTWLSWIQNELSLTLVALLSNRLRNLIGLSADVVVEHAMYSCLNICKTVVLSALVRLAGLSWGPTSIK